MSEADHDPAALRRFLFLLASSRRDGNSETLARHAAARIPPQAEALWLRLMDLDLPEFEDVRHSGSGTYPPPEGDGAVLLDATLWATDLVMVVPLYWYSLPARAKNYLDHWSGWMRVPGVDFLDRMARKTMWAISAVSDENYAVADPLLDTLRLTAEYAKMHWGGHLFGFGNRPGDVLADGDALRQADSFFAAAEAA
jgi:multimeric flavodoxin WrbA